MLLVIAVDELFDTHRVNAGHAVIDNIRRGHYELAAVRHRS
jgi:hypothetical protein